MQKYKATAGIALVVLDHEMPVMDGVEAFRQIPALDPKARFILSTGGTSNLEFKSLIDPAAVWLPKPYTPRELLTAIDEVSIGTATLRCGPISQEAVAVILSAWARGRMEASMLDQ